jgi:alcohol dehydrogenase
MSNSLKHLFSALLRRRHVQRTTICGTDLHILRSGGTIANIGVHGTKVELHLERLWERNITLATRPVDTASTPMLLKTVCSHQIDPTLLMTHRFKLDEIIDAYETFAQAAQTLAPKVIIKA